MLRRITLDNFMSHAHTVIDLSPGLNVLVGPNNCGKSAVVEALRTVCYNEPAEALVRHGERESRITIETDDGHTVVWRRRGAAVGYTIDGRPIDRLNRSVPEDLHAILKLPKVATPQEEFEIHFGMQKFPMFLIDKPGAKAAGFFSTSSDAEKLMEMQRRHKEKVRSAKAEHKEISTDLERLARQLEALAPLDELAGAVEKVESAHQAVLLQRTEAGKLEGAIGRLVAMVALAGRHEGECGVLRELAGPPKMEDVESLERLAGRMVELSGQVGREGQVGKALEGLSQPPQVEETRGLESAIAALERVMEQRVRAVAEAGAVRELTPPPAVEDSASLERFIERMRAAMATCVACDSASAALAGLGEPPTVIETAAMESLIARWEEDRRREAQVKAEIAQIDREMAEVQARAQAWAEANPTCPTCGSAIQAERVLGGGHSHA